ncbi:TRNA pseudouridine synthase [Aphelenchoides bicaudatus]|nr:TRNA pseudouridine synthase [Aphelenchoides bicaudatus]
MAQRYVFWLRFNGSCFNGFAKTGRNGFGGVLDLMDPLLKHVLEPRGFEGLRCSAGSRTDSGVHVLRGPVSVNTEKWKYLMDETPEIKTEILNEFNSVLKDINHESLGVLDLHRVSSGFSLRKNVSYRKYVYRIRVAKSMEIYNDCIKTPTLACFAERHHAWTLPPPFNIHKANEACKKLDGLKNLASFFKLPQRMQPLLPMRDKMTDRYVNLIQVIHGSEISSVPDPNFEHYNLEVVSRSFLREQIRRMATVIVQYAQGNADPQAIDKLIQYPHPDTFTQLKLNAAPAQGLFLVDCVYDPEMFMNPQPYCMHGWDDPNRELVFENEEERAMWRKQNFWA